MANTGFREEISFAERDILTACREMRQRDLQHVWYRPVEINSCGDVATVEGRVA